MHAILEEYAKEQDSIAIGQVDITSSIHVMMKCNVMSSPALILFNEGKSQWQHAGVIDKEKLTKKIKETLGQ